MSDEITCCPYDDCGSPSIRNRVKSGWYCGDCKRRFDEPNRRERKANTRSSGLAGKLEQDDTELAL